MAPLAIDFSGKVALITGSSSGIGEAIAVHFARLGCSVALTGRNEKKLIENKQKCVDTGLATNKVLFVAGDITDAQFQRRLINETVTSLGKIDFLINCAGICHAALDGFSYEERMKVYHETMLINMHTPVSMCELAIENMNANGCVINISSVASMTAEVDCIYYCTSKAALDHYTRTLALQLARTDKKIRVNAINPAAVRTPIFERISGLSTEKVDSEIWPELARQHALGRCGRPEEIAYTAAFLCSEQAAWITGICMPVDGGYTLLSAADNAVATYARSK